MNRAEWQQMARERARDAEVLLAAGQRSGAYYLAGYAVECGLKSCVLVRLAGEPGLIFEERRFSDRCWTHDLEKLVELADLTVLLDADLAANVALNNNWLALKDWTESARYQMSTEAKA